MLDNKIKITEFTFIDLIQKIKQHEDLGYTISLQDKEDTPLGYSGHYVVFMKIKQPEVKSQLLPTIKEVSESKVNMKPRKSKNS